MAKNKKPKYVYNTPHKANVPNGELWTPNEVKAVLLSLAYTLEKIMDTLRDYPLNSEARRDSADIIANIKSAKWKLEKHTMNGEEVTLPDLEPGEENDYLEPES